MDIDLLIEQAETELLPYFSDIDKIAFKNQRKVMDAFKKNRVSEMHFNPSTGYGYDDIGRETLDCVIADIFESESAFVRSSIASGTHAITIGLFGLLRPNDTMLSVTGRPYDTLTGTIGLKGGTGDIGSLMDFGVKYKQIEMRNDANAPIDIDAVLREIKADSSIKVVFVQKSKGYQERLTIKSERIGDLVQAVKAVNPNIYVVVDNCYGEFVEEHEPAYYGADMIIGSLIKNPGGGIAECGGYIAGTKKAVELAAYRLTSPLVGLEVGATLGTTKSIYKGLFYAPHTVAQSLKIACLAAYIYEKFGYEVEPRYSDKRFDIIQTLKFNDVDKLIAFVRGIQAGSAIDSHVIPEPSDMPGYDNKVIMASGSFTQGSSIEISADAPIKPPYLAFMQGGLTYESGKLCIMNTLNEMQSLD